MKLFNGDCLEIMKDIPDESVDLVIIDPPYEFDKGGGGGCFGSKKRNYHKEYTSLYKETGSTKETERLRICSNTDRHRQNLSFVYKGFDFKVLYELLRIMKKKNKHLYMVQ